MTLRPERLKPYGFSDYQARAYVALVGLGPASAGEVAGASGVPQPKVYGVLKELETKGVVVSDLGPPSRYRAVPLGTYLQGMALELRSKAQTLEEEAGALAAEMETLAAAGAESAGRLAAVRGRRNVLARAYEIARGARRSLVIAGVEPGTGESRGFSTVIREKGEEGVPVRVLLPITRENLDLAKRMSRHAEVRHQDRAVSALAMVADEATALISHGRGASAKAIRGTERALVVEEGALIRFASDALGYLWESGMPLLDRAAELQGKTAARIDVLRTPTEAIAALRRMVGGAKAEIAWSGPAMSAFQLAALRTDLHAATRRGVKLRVLVPRTRANDKAVDQLAPLAEVRDAPASVARLVLVDDAQALVLDAGPGAPTPFLDETSFGANNLFATDPSLVGVIRAAFETAWDAARR